MVHQTLLRINIPVDPFEDLRALQVSQGVKYRHGEASMFVERLLLRAHALFADIPWSWSAIGYGVFFSSLFRQPAVVSELEVSVLLFLAYRFVYLRRIPDYGGDVQAVFKYKLLIGSLVFVSSVFVGLGVPSLFRLPLVGPSMNEISPAVLLVGFHMAYCILGVFVFAFFERRISQFIYS